MAHALHCRSTLCRHQQRWQPRPAPRGPQVRVVVAAAAAAEPGDGESSGPSQPWWASLNRYEMRVPPLPMSPRSEIRGDLETREELGISVPGLELRVERQEEWDHMRSEARERYLRGEMPDWFDPNWLTMKESPFNALLRERGDPEYQDDDRWLAPEDGSGSGSGDGSGRRRGKGWWREDDPYWMLRDWGDHPMRWWTYGFAAVVAVGAVLAYALHGDLISLYAGSMASSTLVLCAMGLSDMESGLWWGALAVKAAWVVCALLVVLDFFRAGQRTQQQQQQQQRFPLSVGGLAAAAMCVGYMVTGMSGLDEYALPTTPGAVLKNPDIALKHRVWDKWGLGDVIMRQTPS